MGYYDFDSKQDVLSVKTCTFIEKVLKCYTTNMIDKSTANLLLMSIWGVVSGCVDSDTVTIYDLAYAEINK